MKKTILLAMAFVVASFGLGHLWVEAAPPRPASFYGTVTLNGANVPLPASVEGLIDGVAYAASPVMESGGATVYALDVPGDIPERVGKQGGQAGETIQFRVAGLPCAQTATWTEGVHLNLNLSATGTLPTNTPSPTLSATPTSTITPTPSQTPEVTPTPAIVQLPPDKDTFISEWEPNTNYATDQRLKVRASPYRSLLHFDTSSIPMNSTVSSAELYLYLDWYTYQASQTPNVSAYKVLTDWAEAQATWVMRSSGIGWGSTGCSGTADRDPTAKAFTTMGEPSTWYSWDISGLVQDWVWSPGDNRGLLLVSDGGRELRFHSQNAPNYKPYLRVEYISGTGPGPTPTRPTARWCA